MEVFVNGEKVLVDNKTTLTELLENIGADKLKTVVQLSGEIVRMQNISEKRLKEGDEIEIFSIIGGG
jgi:sulfur carrier protein